MSSKLTETESVYEETSKPEDLKTPLADGFKKVKRITNVTMSHELMRKRRRVKKKDR